MPQRFSRILVATLAIGALSLSAPAVAFGAVRLDPPAGGKRVTVVVAVRSASQVPALRTALARAGGLIDKQYRWNALLVSVPASIDTTGFETTVCGLAGVRYAQRPGIIRAVGTANDQLYPAQWGTTRIGANTAWDVTEGSGVSIAILDTGVDLNHRDLHDNARSFRNYINPTLPAQDDNGHGTHVAGIIAATRNNHYDIAGAAPKAAVYAFKILGADGLGNTADAADAIHDAVDKTNCRIISMSFGATAAGGGNDPTLAEACSYAQSHGVLVVAAAGNSGNTTQFYPAAFPGVVGVGATDSGSNNPRASFSNHGVNLVDLVAPGVNIVSTYWTKGKTNQDAYLSGTSMATPYVAASAALLMARNPALDATQVVDLLQATATDLGAAGRDDLFGYGLVRPDVAISLSTPDIYEVDDTAATAKTAVLGTSYAHSLYPVGESDFHMVTLTSGRTYRFETSRLLPGADTLLDVIGTDTVSVVASNDDRSPGDRSSSVTYTPSVSGTYYLRVSDPHSLGGGYTVRAADITASLNTTRLAGATRYDCAVRIAKEAYPGWAGVTDVVVASGEDAAAADPLSAAGLCNLYHAPLLITKGAALSPEVAAAIAAMPAPVKVHIVGGPGSVKPAVLTALARLSKVSSVDRISGADRYALAANVAERMRTGASVPPTVALIANGAQPKTFFDALALSAVASHMGFPILLVKPTAVPGATAHELAVLAPSQTWVAGGAATVSNPVYSAVHASGRWWGATRYDTAVAVANGAIARGWLGADHAVLAAKLPDALTGGAALGSKGAPVLVTAGTSLSAQPLGFLLSHRTSLWGVYVLGGTGSLSTAVQSSIVSQLQ